jgi:hypothetical protein
MVRTEISLFLPNVPGELGKLTTLLSRNNINIDAITIQDASGYVRELFKARGKSLKRIASAASYSSMSKDSADFALIRILPANGLTNKAIDLLSGEEYIFDIMPVIAIELDNRPGELAKVATRMGEEGITSTMSMVPWPLRRKSACSYSAPTISSMPRGASASLWSNPAKRGPRRSATGTRTATGGSSR